MQRTLLTLLASFVAGVALSACSGSSDKIKFVSGPQGGSWYPLAGAFKNIIENRVKGISLQILPGAGIANAKALESGQAQIGFANSVSTVDAINGQPPFETKATHICNVATLYPQYFQVVVLPDAGIRSPADLKGKSLAGQPKGNTAEAMTVHLLKAYGMTLEDLSRVNYGSYTDSVELMKDANAQVFTLGTTIPAGAVMDLASARDIRVLDIPDDGLAKMREFNPGYRRGIIPAGTYPKQDKDVATVEYATHLIARCDVEEKLVYDMLDAIYSHVDDLAAVTKAMKGATPQTMGRDIGVPMHAGAARWYREKAVN